MAAVAAPPSPKAARTTLVALIAIAIIGLFLHIGWSTEFLSPWRVLEEILHGPSNLTNENSVVWRVRLPRALTCIFVGGILAGVGSAFQALFRNPLADPYVVGVSSGAAAGSVAAMIAGVAASMGGLGQAAAGFVGGMLTLALVMALAQRRGGTSVVTLLLAGVVIGSMLSGALSLGILASGRDANQLLMWLLGNTSDPKWPDVALLAIACVAGSVALILQARSLNAFAVGEETARRLGVDTRRLKIVVLVTGTAMTAVAVGTTGVIAFVGLVAPHIARALVGMDWRRSLLGSVVVGAVLLLVADVLAQRVIPFATGRLGYSPVTDLPVGVVTALIGAPSLLILLRRSR
jgi:iron complex transport system permease protein